MRPLGMFVTVVEGIENRGVSRASAGHAGLVADLPRHTGVSAGDRRIAHRHEIFPGIRVWGIPMK